MLKHVFWKLSPESIFQASNFTPLVTALFHKLIYYLRTQYQLQFYHSCGEIYLGYLFLQALKLTL